MEKISSTLEKVCRDIETYEQDINKHIEQNLIEAKEFENKIHTVYSAVYNLQKSILSSEESKEDIDKYLQEAKKIISDSEQYMGAE